MSKKLTQLPELTTPDDNDQLVTVDTEVGSTKRVTRGNFLNNAIKTVDIQNSAVTTPKIADANVTPSKLATGAATATVTTSQGTTTGYATDLATIGPSVAVSIGSNGLALVSIKAFMSQNTGASYAYIGFSVSGATTVAANIPYSISYQPLSGMTGNHQAATFLVTGLTAGTNTFTMKYGVGGGGTATYSDRIISVVPL